MKLLKLLCRIFGHRMWADIRPRGGDYVNITFRCLRCGERQ